MKFELLAVIDVQGWEIAMVPSYPCTGSQDRGQRFWCYDYYPRLGYAETNLSRYQGLSPRSAYIQMPTRPPQSSDDNKLPTQTVRYNAC